MRDFEFVEEFPGWPQLSFPGVLKTLPNALFCIRAGCDIEQTLVGFRILNNGRSLPVHGQHQCALAFPELFHEIAGPPTEASQGLDILGNIEHDSLQSKHLMRCFQHSTVLQ